MSSFAGYCDWCGKPVMHKTFFGTLHLCLTDEEKFQVAVNAQRNAKPVNLEKLFAGAGAAYRPKQPLPKTEGKAWYQDITCPKCGNKWIIRRMEKSKPNTLCWCDNCRKEIRPKHPTRKVKT